MGELEVGLTRGLRAVTVAAALRNLLGNDEAGAAIQAAVRRSRRRSGSLGEVHVTGEQAVIDVAAVYRHALVIGS